MNNDILDKISAMEMGVLNFDDIIGLTMELMHNLQEDAIEKFFLSISDYDYQRLENEQEEILYKLIEKLKEYYISQSWGFDYTDIIGALCQRLYNLTSDNSIRAMLLFIILQVGESHNRYYVMRIGQTLINHL